ncbi:ABC transporter ATP-binding protein [Chamaesiphon sp. GL140_3_metabinner_50]|uniref:ABC transporter ATP-binding protein n=1 Tax=Chamaesiphon sp. GL140_3_metabinner_50 TaxID=2970812 RepID=UPI0025D356AE|nr:ABC transporter ATP-binding protein [Chamaesiphon sp. GL140_3_metabinner_50]
MAQVTLENIYKSYTPTASKDKSKPQTAATPAAEGVLRRINLTVNNGEFMVLVGASGCGKSTLLRLIAGLETITAGTISIGDVLVNDLPPKEREIAMVFQSYALYPHMRVYDNIAFGLRRSESLLTPGLVKQSKGLSPQVENFLVEITRGFPRGLRYISAREKIIGKKVRQVAEMLQIEGLLGRFPKQLSGGQKQRVALGRAIAREAKVFLMDEPLSNLDAKLRAETRAQIVKLQRQLGTTTIYVTHDQTEAMTMGDRIAVMNRGQIQQVATPLEIYNHPANIFVAQFIGSPPMNLIPVQVKLPLSIGNHQFRVTLPEAWENCLEQSVNRPLLMGIRPEHLTLGLPATKNFHGIIETVEALGNDTYIGVKILDLEPTDLILNVRVSPDKVVTIGEEVWLSATTDKIHLFDRDTTLALQIN